MSTPHRGTEVALDKIGRIGKAPVTLPLGAAQSELLVKSGHGTRERPLAIRELRRFMLKQAKKNSEATP